MGSSPLARGPPGRRTFRRSRHGLIPARAGTTTGPCRSHRSARAHPRSRGDHGAAGQPRFRHLGSSPLARGPLLNWLHQREACGLIPARAGTTIHRPRASRGGRAHPRSRGDHSMGKKCDRWAWGSSPLARGPQHGQKMRQVGVGLIPARAGTTLCVIGIKRHREAHPRSRGDHEGVTHPS